MTGKVKHMHPADLSEFQANLPGCETALLADIGTSTCLVSASALHIGQEQLDVLCRQAKLYLNDLPPHPEKSCVIAGPRGAQVYFRPSPTSSEVMCLTFAPSASLHGIDDEILRVMSQSLGQAS
ncbi:MAG: hypothetical protein AAF393_00580 [Pseudomonadota bacterium]